MLYVIITFTLYKLLIRIVATDPHNLKEYLNE